MTLLDFVSVSLSLSDSPLRLVLALSGHPWLALPCVRLTTHPPLLFEVRGHIDVVGPRNRFTAGLPHAHNTREREREEERMDDHSAHCGAVCLRTSDALFFILNSARLPPRQASFKDGPRVAFG